MNAFNLKKSVAAVVLAGLSMVGAAASAQTVVGGGATLPQGFYSDLISTEFSTQFAPYVGTGSGTGKTAFVTNNGSLFNATGSAHYAGSDSALTQGNLNTYAATSGGNWGPVIQVPAFATPVLLPYRLASVSGTGLDLSDEQVCQVFGVPDQTWDEVLGNGDTNQVVVVYRTDGSGTTELLANYLSQACEGWGFQVSNQFSTVVSGAIGAIPSHWIGVSGSTAMGQAAYLANVNARIGYLSPDPVFTGLNPAQVASINGAQPLASAIQAALPTPPAVADRADPLAWVPAYELPGSGYPIFGTTNLLVNQCYTNSTVEANVKAFVARINALNSQATPNLIDQHNFIKLSSAWNTVIDSTFLDASSPLGIGNATACGTNGRP